MLCEVLAAPPPTRGAHLEPLARYTGAVVRWGRCDSTPRPGHPDVSSLHTPQQGTVKGTAYIPVSHLPGDPGPSQWPGLGE